MVDDPRSQRGQALTQRVTLSRPNHTHIHCCYLALLVFSADGLQGLVSVAASGFFYAPHMNGLWMGGSRQQSLRHLTAKSLNCLVPDEGIEPPTFGLQNRGSGKSYLPPMT
jgi:hypothetical protein